MKRKVSKVAYGENELLDSGIQLLEVEYYKIFKEDKKSYGVQISKNQVINNIKTLETKCIYDITEKESVIDNIIKIFAKNKVTPIIMDDVVEDYLKIY